MNTILTLNGQVLAPTEYDGVDGVTVTVRRIDSDGKRNSKSASGQIKFYGSAWQTLKAELIDMPDGKLRSIPATLVVECDGEQVVLVDGVIKGSEIDWCDDDCFVTGAIVEHTEDSIAADCVKSTLVYDNHNGFIQAAHPRVVYCDELRPEWLHHVILISSIILLLLYDLLTPVIVVISLMISVINLIIGAVNTLPGVNIDPIDFDGDPDTTTFDEWQNMRQNLTLTVIGCGRKHPTPLLREYVKNVCLKCGLEFHSSILNDPSSEYFNTLYLNAPVKKGTRDEALNFIWENRPIETLERLLDRVKTVHNAEWLIVDGKLHYERRDMLPGADPWIDPEAIKSSGRMVSGVCYEWSADEPASYLEIAYTDDTFDEPGNESNALYSDIVEWNSPPNEMQRGFKQVQFEFGPSRYRRDGVDTDVLDVYRWFWGFTGAIDQHGSAMLLSRGICSNPKLVIWDGSSQAFATVKKYNVPGYVKPPDENFNFPYHVNQHNVSPNTAYSTDEPLMALYGRFHAIDNPRVSSDKGLSWKMEWEYTFTELLNANAQAEVPLSVGTGLLNEYTINTKTGTILAEGTV